ncbi:transcriptional regulator, LysR family [Roseovarius nanhaiticus]|uniref:Transcriptional regulator, LysR family n=1 Tax=Roseovarius nanhaiticus TaxID=573024 RepID=A0A1N7H4X8_9RHOB|nr:LysR family transcriptional regulator [Roseovarius nanhaiticus]SEL13102.1 transcriptional regulator, LysR family [Roseovarius nanhaiticus]SIS19790.1 transcriptional regulator, LysR family [Roseovarius nanhaiticus]
MAGKALDGIPLDWVRAFEAAARLGSFTAAATETGLTQAAISQRIANLEARLGAPLFHRGARGVSLTASAEAWLPHASAALGLLRQSAEDIFGTGARALTIVASASITRGWLMPRLTRLKMQGRLSFKTLMVEADEAPGRGIAVVRYGAGTWAGLRARRLYAEELAPVAAPSLRQGDIAALPRIHVTGPRAGWSDWDGPEEPGAGGLRCDSMGAGIAAAEAGMGVLLASLPLCAEALAAGRLARLDRGSLMPGAAPWLTARPEDIGQRQWDALKAAFCDG